jgi:hypothetical protein
MLKQIKKVKKWEIKILRKILGNAHVCLFHKLVRKHRHKH